jgi:ABC-type branched-subunit amino acid transport system substrate-binding protein
MAQEEDECVQPSRVDWKFLLVALWFLVAVISTSCSGHSGEQPDEILIGAYGPLTGSAATQGISIKNGIDMAQDKANTAGAEFVTHSWQLIFVKVEGKVPRQVQSGFRHSAIHSHPCWT